MFPPGDVFEPLETHGDGVEHVFNRVEFEGQNFEVFILRSLDLLI